MSGLAGRLVLKRGDLFDTTCPIIAHGCNTAGAFGSGVAGQIAARWIEVRHAYIDKHLGGGWRLGEVQVVDVVGHPVIRHVANLATQKLYGRFRGVVYADYNAIRRSVSTLLDIAEEMEMSVAMPRIGCGLAGGDWGIVSGVLSECVRDRSIHVEVWTL